MSEKSKLLKYGLSGLSYGMQKPRTLCGHFTIYGENPRMLTEFVFKKDEDFKNGDIVAIVKDATSHKITVQKIKSTGATTAEKKAGGIVSAPPNYNIKGKENDVDGKWGSVLIGNAMVYKEFLNIDTTNKGNLEKHLTELRIQGIEIKEKSNVILDIYSTK